MKQVTSIHQVFITDESIDSEFIPKMIQYNMDTLPHFCEESFYKLWRSDEIIDFIDVHFGKEVSHAYAMLSAYSSKCDLARYCILSVLGGLYADLSIRLQEPLEIPDEVGLVAFRDLEFGSPAWFACNGGLIWAEPGRPEFDRAIEMVLENCRERFYGRNSLYPVGPVVWGRAIVETAARSNRFDGAHDQWLGSMRLLYPDASAAAGFFTPDRRLVALRAKKIGADLTHLGAEGVNNYAEIWTARKTYGESGQAWTHDDPSFGVTNLGQRRENGVAFLGKDGDTVDQEFCVTYGPYVDIEAGNWIVTLSFYRPTTIPDFTVEVCCDYGRSIIQRNDFAASELPIGSLRIPLSLTSGIEKTEFRTIIRGAFEGLIASVRLEPAP